MTQPSQDRHRHHLGGREPHIVRLGGLEWPSIASCAAAIGYDYRNLAKVLKKPEESVARRNLNKAVEAYKAKISKKPCR